MKRPASRLSNNVRLLVLILAALTRVALLAALAGLLVLLLTGFLVLPALLSAALLTALVLLAALILVLVRHWCAPWIGVTP
jgi:hypothetical protein